MSMLVDFNKQNNWVLTPRGKKLHEDDANIGNKLLRKMGWKCEEGLGVNGKGITEPIKIKYKDDKYGIGAEDRNDQWSEQTDQYSALLERLSNTNNNNNDDNKFIPSESLEAKSKQSKSRVHYKKFTKGKDLSQYSEQDIANIFGKKTLKKPIKIVEKVEHKSNITQNTEKISEVSAYDYYKEKMEKFRMRASNNNIENNTEKNNISKSEVCAAADEICAATNEQHFELANENIQETAIKKIKKKKIKEIQSESENKILTVDNEKNIELENAVKSKKKKLKRKKNYSEGQEVQDVQFELNGSINAIDVNETSDKELVHEPKKKKKKIKINEISYTENDEDLTVENKTIEIEDNKGTIDDNVDGIIPTIDNPSENLKKIHKNNKKLLKQLKKCQNIKQNLIKNLVPEAIIDITEASDRNNVKKKKKNKRNKELDLKGNKEKTEEQNKEKDTAETGNSRKRKCKVTDKTDIEDCFEVIDLNDDQKQEDEDIVGISKYKNYKRFNQYGFPEVFEITPLTVEKYQNIISNGFKNSNFGDIIGYGLTRDPDINIVEPKKFNINNATYKDLVMWKKERTSAYNNITIDRMVI